MNHLTQEEPAALQLAKALRRGINATWPFPPSESERVRLDAANELERLHLIVNGPSVDPAAVLAAAGVVA